MKYLILIKNIIQIEYVFSFYYISVLIVYIIYMEYSMYYSKIKQNKLLMTILKMIYNR